jgi:hypothetical protein
MIRESGKQRRYLRDKWEGLLKNLSNPNPSPRRPSPSSPRFPD